MVPGVWGPETFTATETCRSNLTVSVDGNWNQQERRGRTLFEAFHKVLGAYSILLSLKLEMTTNPSNLVLLLYCGDVPFDSSGINNPKLILPIELC